MIARASRPLTPAEAVRQGRKLIAERRRQEAVRKAAMQPEGGVEAEAGKPVPDQDQRVEVALEVRVDEPPPAIPAIAGLALLMAADGRLDEFWPKHPDGTWPLADLRSGQCRFACTADDALRDQHRFCGGPIAWLRGKPTNWCADHLPRVMGAPGRSAGGMSVAQAQAAAIQEESA